MKPGTSAARLPVLAGSIVAAADVFALLSCGSLVHHGGMTRLLDKAIERARALPPETQDASARAMLVLLDDEPEPIAHSAEEQASFAKSLEQAARGEFASDERVRAIWAKHGL